MKTLIISDKFNIFHWTLLKSVLLILTLLPMSHGLINIVQTAQGSSQIMIGFFMLSIFSSLLVLSFCSAVRVSVLELNISGSELEHALFKVYRYVPLLFLASMVSYLAFKI